MQRNTCVYHVITTEFWRSSYQIAAAGPTEALAAFERLKRTSSLPRPSQMPLGFVDPPEEVRDAHGATVYLNLPPADDAERMLFLEMWRRMRAHPAAIDISLPFICQMKNWDAAAMSREVGR